MNDTLAESPTGFDVDRVTAWLSEQVADLVPPLRWSQLPGGHSNLTYRIEDATGRRFVIRRPPLGPLLPTAHDMRREFTIISALWPTPVPVAEPVAFTDDATVADAPFYVMGWVEGRSLYTADETAEHLRTDEARVRAGLSLMDTLAALHRLDPDAVGLGDLGKRSSYVGRQLHRWYESWNASKDRELPDVDRLHQFLVDRLPEQTKVSVVHGDYGLHNCRVTTHGDIGAVLDWEISTLGDPLADLAYCINTWEERGDANATRQDAPTTLPGFSTRQELITHYGERTDLDVSQLDYYRCFNYWKAVCILQGVYARYRDGQKSTDDIDIGALAKRLDRTLRQAVDAADRLT
jgi:aminoglycoside phosphotransferase (APT) family kinase protein